MRSKKTRKPIQPTCTQHRKITIKIDTKIRHEMNAIDINIKAMGEEMRHVQMSRWGKHIGEESKQQ